MDDEANQRSDPNVVPGKPSEEFVSAPLGDGNDQAPVAVEDTAEPEAAPAEESVGVPTEVDPSTLPDTATPTEASDDPDAAVVDGSAGE